MFGVAGLTGLAGAAAKIVESEPDEKTGTAAGTIAGTV